MENSYLGRDKNPLPITIVDSKGSFIYTENNECFIDFFMGWNVGNAGWNLDIVNKAIRNYKGPSYVSPACSYQGWEKLAKLLAKISPGNLTKSFRATGGTEAVELALRMSIAYTGKKKFISIAGSYHGHSLATMSIGDDYFWKYFGNFFPDSHQIKTPLTAEAAEDIRQLLEKKDIAAVIMEPIICNLGVVIPDNNFFKHLSEDCKRNNTVLIIDEVATGFGRTGKLFASEHFDLQPDILCLGKALSNGQGAIGATITTEKIAKSMQFNFSQYSTYGWHPLSTEAAIASINYYLEEKIWKLATVNGTYLKKALENIKFKSTFEIRGKGMAIGVTFDKENYAEKLKERCFEKGLLLSTLGPQILVIFPALNIERKTLNQGIEIIRECA